MRLRRELGILLVVLMCSSAAWSQDVDDAQWKAMLKDGMLDRATAFCKGLTETSDVAKQVEGHKCLANVALQQPSGLQIQGNDAGGGMLGPGYTAAAIDDALGHLDAAMKLAPQDLSLHQGRLHLLEISYRFDAMAKALEESCTIYKGPDVPDAWLAYTYELGEDKQYKAALALLQILDRHYPNNHDIVGNIGAMYSFLQQDDEAVRYLKRAIELAPDDPIDNWNLGRLYDYTGKSELADQYYNKSMSVDTDTERLRENRCLYGYFVEKQLHDKKRACTLQKKNCPPDERTACR